jgi:hypothetical protein
MRLEGVGGLMLDVWRAAGKPGREGWKVPGKRQASEQPVSSQANGRQTVT